MSGDTISSREKSEPVGVDGSDAATHRGSEGDLKYLRKAKGKIQTLYDDNHRIKLHGTKPFFGKDGPGGHWYIRLPLWIQSTILIFFIGFVCILILTVISAVQVWSYTEQLMQNRLSSLAGMTAIELEQTFNSLERSGITGGSSKMIDLLTTVNENKSSTGWVSFNREITDQLSLSDCLAVVLYDKYLRPVYSYRKRTSSDGLLGQQSDFIPHTLFPLSNDELRADMLANLVEYKTTVLANATVNQVQGSTKSANITYSISKAVSSNPEYNNLDSFQSRFNNYVDSQDWIGYLTYILKSPISSTVVNEQQFPRYVIEVVRLNDISLRTSYESSLRSGEFTFLYPFIADNGYVQNHQSWPISSFPVLLDAIELVNKVPRLNESALNKTQESRLHDSFDGYQIEEKQQLGHLRNSNHKSNSSASFMGPKNSSMGGNSSSTTNSGRGNSSSAVNTTSPSGDNSSIKTDSAAMRTRSPFNNKSSIGYSYANIFNQKWLVFVQIPESEAFTDVWNLRNVLIGVGCGILGAVLLILLPLSRWQTRGFYVIYENMKLRPLFVCDDSPENDAEELAHACLHPLTSSASPESIEKRDNVNQLNSYENAKSQDGNSTPDHIANGGSLQRQALPAEPTSSDSILSRNRDDNENEAARDPAYLETARRASGQSHRTSGEEVRLNIPKPLPPLNRWYKDEVDDLITEYNNMAEKLNAHYLHLEDQVRIRTREVQKARELREEANVAKSEFIAIISHELRTPLNGVMGLTAVSVDETDITKIRSALQIIIDSGHTLMGLLNELLELSKSLVGVDPVVEEFTPESLLGALPNIFSSRTSSSSVTFGLTSVPYTINKIRLKGDIEHVTQVCLNFMSNAMKFSEGSGFVSVLLHIRPLNDPLINLKPYGDKLKNANGILEILVTDSGVGVSKSQLAKIFDLFVQGEDPLRKNRKGAGLGMALSKQLAEGIGGYVAVFSAKDIGTTTIIRVPVEVINYTNSSVAALNAPPLEFKVKEVYSTISLQPGEVTPVALPPTPSTPSQVAGNHFREQMHPSNSSSLPKRSRHSQHSSGGSRMLLPRSHQVSKLLRAHSQHRHNRSEYSNRSHGSGSTEACSELASMTEPGTHVGAPASAVMNSVIPAYGGSKANASVSSLLLNVPEYLFDNERHGRSKSASHSCESVDMEDSRDTKSVLSPDEKVRRSVSFGHYGRLRGLNRHRPEAILLPAKTTASSMGTPTALKSGSTPSLVDTAPASASSDPQRVVYISSPERSPSPSIEIDTNTRILLAEDNKLNQEILIKMLSHLGVKNVDTADDGESVIKLIERSIVDGVHYGIVFMDLSMPGINGIDATQIIRTTLGYPYPIVALTGFSDLQTRNACLAVNIQEVLTKPVMRLDILRVLQKYASVDPQLANKPRQGPQN